MLGVGALTLAWVAGAGPGSEHQQQTGVSGGTNLVALLRDPVGHRSDPRRLALSILGELDLAVDDHEVAVFVDLVLLKLLAGRKVDRNRPRRPVIRAQDLRVMRLNVE